MDANLYRPTFKFSDEYCAWLGERGLLCADDNVFGWQCNVLLLSVQEACMEGGVQAEEIVEYVQSEYKGNYTEIWWAGEVVGPKKRDAYSVALNYMRCLIEGTAEVFRAREAITNNVHDRALIFLCNAAEKLGAARGMCTSMTDVARKATRSARNAAVAKHAKPGGSKDKQEAIRAAWASGKYTNRTRCAEEECAALGMSYDAARKALRNTPDPA